MLRPVSGAPLNRTNVLAMSGAVIGAMSLTHDAEDQPVSVSMINGPSTIPPTWGSAQWDQFQWTQGTPTPLTTDFTYDGNPKRVKDVEGSTTTYTVYSLASGLVYRDVLSGSSDTRTTYLSIGPVGIRFANGAPTCTHFDAQGSGGGGDRCLGQRALARALHALRRHHRQSLRQRQRHRLYR